MSTTNPESKPIRRTLFKKSAYAKPITTEKSNENDLFNRSKDLFSSVIEEQRKEAEETRVAKREEARLSEERKRRRTSTPGDDWDVSSNEDSDSRRVRKRSEDESATSTPQELKKYTVTSHESPIRKSPRNSTISRTQSDVSATTFIQNTSNAITLSDSEDEDVSYVKSRQPSAPIIDPIPVSDDDEVENYHESMATARARTEEVKKTHMADRVAQRMAQLRAGTKGFESAAIKAPPALDPIIEFFVSSEAPGTQPLVVRRKVSQRLREVRLAWCDLQVVEGRKMKDNEKDAIFLTWRGHKLFDSSTGAGLPGIKSDTNGTVRASEGDGYGWHQGKVWLQAWTLRDFEDWKQQVAREKARALAEPEEQGEEETMTKFNVPSNDESTVDQGAPIDTTTEEKIRIILKVRNSKDSPEVKILVRLTSKIEQVITVFRKRAQVGPEQKVVLRFEGDILEPESTIGEADMEDMDQIDVHVS